MSRHAHIRFRMISVALMLALAQTVSAGEDRQRRHPLAPDFLKCQYAGNMGVVSAGMGYALLDGRMQTDLFYGYAPKRYCGESIHHVTWKNTVLPLSVRLSDTVKWAPVTLGSHFSLKVGKNNRQTWVILPDRYPDNYYPPTALHLLLTLGTAFDYRVPGSSRSTGVFFEGGTTALYLRDWIRESHVSFTDIVSFSFGMVRGF